MIFKNEKIKRAFIFYLLINFVGTVIYPTCALALTGGPSQGEFESFEPAGASEMVNVFNGDFTYNVPLLDVDGYPINISYHAGIGPEQEATWVGLGWSLNPGSISRGMRGLPDDFDGDIITNDVKIKNNDMYGISVGGGGEILGFGGQAGLGLVYNNYKGIGIEADFGVSGSVQAGSLIGVGVNAGANLRISSQDGVDFTEGYGTSVSGIGKGGLTNSSKNTSVTVNSRNGMTENLVGGSKSTSSCYFYWHGNSNEINLVPNTAYSPNLQYPTTFSGFTGEIHLGGQVFWSNIYGYTKGYYLSEGLTGNHFALKSYGYFNLNNADATSAIDFNRDIDGVYYLQCPKLPAASLTYDVYSVNAQGMGMLYRPHRNDFGAVYDNFISSSGSTSSLSVEGNYGDYFQLGMNDQTISSSSTSGKWTSNNNTIGEVNFKGNNKLFASNSGKTYEPVHFKDLSSLSVMDYDALSTSPVANQLDTKIGGDQLSSFELAGTGGNNSYLTGNIINSTGTSSLNNVFRNTRQPRSSDFSYLTAADASVFGFEPTIKSYTPGVYSLVNNDLSSFTTLNRTGYHPGIQSSHISEVTVLKDDGARYIFGIPVYNWSYNEVMFNASGLGTDCSRGLVNYSGSDNTTSNGNGIDNYYMKKTIPAYAHSFLLTSVLSSDYIDITGNGPSSDDYGNYTKFNYTKANTSDYNWRSPCTGTSITSPQAIFNKNLLADPYDDKGMYLNGSKDIWYVHSVESANYVAVFVTSARQDGFPVINENGGISTSSPLKQLDKIILYSKKDMSTPLKTVNFQYDYSLCGATPNSSAGTAPNGVSNGKLTLKSIYFTYGNSQKGRFNAFNFIYGDADHDGSVSSTEQSIFNPNYSRTSIDRWGTYTPNTGDCNAGGTHLGFDEFPYSIQNKANADQNSAAWCLTDIQTPAGSQINVSYESDDYAYIQDKVAGQMVTLVDMLNSVPSGYDPATAPAGTYPKTNASLYTSASSLNLYAIVDLQTIGGIDATLYPSTGAANQVLQAQILPQSSPPQNGQLYFKSMVQLGSNDATTFEYVPGYATINAANAFVVGNPTHSLYPPHNLIYRYACIPLNAEDIDDSNTNPVTESVNPISKAGWQMTRLYEPRIAYPGNDPMASSVQAIVGLLSALSEALTFNQKNGRLRTKGFSQTINCAKSWFRVSNYSKNKLGGGHRVKEIDIVDNWQSMVTSESTSTYGQTYDYTTTETQNGPSISSGVASYEPLIGGDEISLRTPIEYSVNHILAPNDQHFVENPVGEPFFPPPSVGYSKITVRNINHNIGAIQVQNIGRTEYQFFTSKDYPIKTSYTGTNLKEYSPSPTQNLYDSYLEDNVYLSQGFLIKLNDMHGKLKSVMTFQEGQTNAISGVINYYNSVTGSNELDNFVPVINEKNQISSQFLGRTIDATGDFRATSTSTFGNTFMANLNVSPLPIPIAIPIPIPTFFSGFSSDLRTFQSATLTKIVNQQGILKSVQTISDYVTTTNENLIWDAETGDVIVHSTTNAFKDPIYHFEYPAHWVYSGMGGAFQNINISYVSTNVLTNPTPLFDITTGKIDRAQAPLLFPGDELAIIGTNASDGFVVTSPQRLFVAIDPSSTSTLLLINRNGVTITNSLPAVISFLATPGLTNLVLKVVRSGHRNMMSESAGEITSLSNFNSGLGYLNLSNNSSASPQTNVLSATTMEFSEQWNSDINPSLCVTNEGLAQNKSTNPYIIGLLGNWHEKRDYSYLTDRVPNSSSGEFNIRKDGTFSTFKPFFLYDNTTTNSWLPIYNTNYLGYTNVSTSFDNWVLMNQINKISPEGSVLESKDGINRYSASLFSYNNTLKVADAKNAKVREIGSANFEDNSYNLVKYVCNCDRDKPVPSPFNFSSCNTTTVTAHSGRYSLAATPSSSASQLSSMYTLSSSDYIDYFGSNYVNTGSSIGSPNYNLVGFSPESDLPNSSRYVVSFWAKESVPNNTGSYASPGINVYFNNVLQTPVPVTVPSIQKTQIINGWQKFEYWFDIPATVGPIQIKFTLLNSPTTTIYYDDIRVHPFNAALNTYVYDPLSLRKWAELDERNFTTFYEYDNEGLLVRIKKETEKGIITVSETRNSLIKK